MKNAPSSSKDANTVFDNSPRFAQPAIEKSIGATSSLNDSFSLSELLEESTVKKRKGGREGGGRVGRSIKAILSQRLTPNRAKKSVDQGIYM